MILAAAILSMTISAPVCSAPCMVKITVKIENASERDHCELIIDGDDEFHGSEIEVVTDRRTYETQILVRNPGEYVVRAILQRPVNHRYEVTHTLLVTGRGNP